MELALFLDRETSYVMYLQYIFKYLITFISWTKSVDDLERKFVSIKFINVYKIL